MTPANRSERTGQQAMNFPSTRSSSLCLTITSRQAYQRNRARQSPSEPFIALVAMYKALDGQQDLWWWWRPRPRHPRAARRRCRAGASTSRSSSTRRGGGAGHGLVRGRGMRSAARARGPGWWRAAAQGPMAVAVRFIINTRGI